jgi:intracellular sulfur oxidation DsrE/DsrF family protein
MTGRAVAIVFTRFGLGHAPEDLQLRLAGNFLTLLMDASEMPSDLLFYADGVKLVCEGSPVLEQLRALQGHGATLLICRTCLDYFRLSDKVRVGTIGGMPGILDAIARADKVVSV